MKNAGYKLKVKVFNGGQMPEFKTDGAACFDICADLKDYFNEEVVLRDDKSLVIPTGLMFHIPQGYKLEVYSRSGLTAKHGVIVLNAPAQIDSDYTGELKIILKSTRSTNFYTVKHGDRIAQAALVPVVNTRLVETEEEPPETERGANGLGSTGK